MSFRLGGPFSQGGQLIFQSCPLSFEGLQALRSGLKILFQLAHLPTLPAQLVSNRLLGFGPTHQLASDPAVLGRGGLVIFGGRSLLQRGLRGALLHVSPLVGGADPP